MYCLSTSVRRWKTGAENKIKKKCHNCKMFKESIVQFCTVVDKKCVYFNGWHVFKTALTWSKPDLYYSANYINTIIVCQNNLDWTV